MSLYSDWANANCDPSEIGEEGLNQCLDAVNYFNHAKPSKIATYCYFCCSAPEYVVHFRKKELFLCVKHREEYDEANK